MEKLKYTIICLLMMLPAVLASCIEDGVSTNASEQPVFSTDTVKMGEVFTQEATPTSRFIVHNRYDKIMSIERISLREGENEYFRLNVDGVSAKSFSNVEIRPNDSIFVFVEALLPSNGVDTPVTIDGHLDFTTHGNTETVVLRVIGQDVERLNAVTLSKNTTLTANRPYQIFDSLIVEQGVTLNVEAGAKLHFHDGAYLKVYGTLKCNGTAQKQINLTGDRSGYVAASIPYEIMSGQWGGVYFTSTSRDNELSFTSIRNTKNGVRLDNVKSKPALTLISSQIHNSAGPVLQSVHSDINAYATEFSEGAEGVLLLQGGNHELNHCTLANYYLFSAITGAALQLSHLNADSDDESGEPYMTANVDNCIIYGLGSDISHGDLTGTSVYIRNTLLRSAGKDDDNFIKCIWDTDPMYYTVRNDYYFDYRLQPESPAIGAADPMLTNPLSKTDRYGNRQPSAPDLGAYVFVAEEK